MEEKIKVFKETMEKGMLLNFEKDGTVRPVFFFMGRDFIPNIVGVPDQLLSSANEKKLLVANIRKICSIPGIICAGLIIEAYSRVFHPNDPLGHLVLAGEVEVKQLREKKEVVLMVFSTPEKEEMITYDVDPSKKLVNRRKDFTPFEGIFSQFFKSHR